MKKVAITQPYLFPYLGYFQIMNAVDEYVFFDDVQYIVRGWINRNNILVNNDKHLFTISLDNASANKNINEINIKDDFVKFQKMLAMSYAKAPHKDKVLALIEDICNYDDRNLAHFTENSLKKIAAFIGINPVFRSSEEIKIDNSRRAQHRIIDICKSEKADVYINTYGGVDLYDNSLFEQNNLELQFLKTNLKPYKQLKGDFIQGLSIIDVMMFNDIKTINKMLNDFEIIKEP